MLHSVSRIGKPLLATLIASLVLLALPARAAGPVTGEVLDLTTSGYGITSLIIFVLAYTVVIGEEFLHLRRDELSRGVNLTVDPGDIGLSLEGVDQFDRHFKPVRRPFDIFISVKRAEFR